MTASDTEAGSDDNEYWRGVEVTAWHFRTRALCDSVPWMIGQSMYCSCVPVFIKHVSWLGIVLISIIIFGHVRFDGVIFVPTFISLQFSVP